MYCDSHFHLRDLNFFAEKSLFSLEKTFAFPLKAVSSCLSKDDFYENMKILEENKKIFKEKNIFIKLSFALHPQNLIFLSPEEIEDELLFQEKLAAEKKIIAIGECGFDFYEKGSRKYSEIQRKVFERQVDLAIKTGLPLVIHERKALDQIFSFSLKLSRVKKVIFHGFSYSVKEAEDILRKGVPAYFSIGKGIFRENSRTEKFVSNRGFENLLLETDSPFMALKESFTEEKEIVSVYKKAASLVNMDLEELKTEINSSFDSAFNWNFQ